MSWIERLARFDLCAMIRIPDNEETEIVVLTYDMILRLLPTLQDFGLTLVKLDCQSDSKPHKVNK